MLFHVQDVDNYIHIRDLIRAEICNCFHLIKIRCIFIILYGNIYIDDYIVLTFYIKLH